MILLISLSFIIVIILLLLNYYITTNSINNIIIRSLNIYECGFSAYLILRKILAKFYILAIIFLLFDLELSYILITLLLPIYKELLLLNNIYILNLYILILIILFIGMLLELYYNIIYNSQFV